MPPISTTQNERQQQRVLEREAQDALVDAHQPRRHRVVFGGAACRSGVRMK